MKINSAVDVLVKLNSENEVVNVFRLQGSNETMKFEEI